MLRPAFAAVLLLSMAPLLSADFGFGDRPPWSRLSWDDLPQDPEPGGTALQPSHLLCPLHWFCPAFARLQLTPESLGLFYTCSRALWPFCGVLLASWLWHKVRRRRRREKVRTALVSVGTDCQECTCCSHEALRRLADSTALMRSYLRRLRHLHWQESRQRLHRRRPEWSTKRKRKVEDEQEEERLMSACLYNPSYSGAADMP
nr:uncharacterized protein LOC106045612 [Anser cygnoides]